LAVLIPIFCDSSKSCLAGECSALMSQVHPWA
jgi:hypothetical protein